MSTRRAWLIVVGAQLVKGMVLASSIRHIVKGIEWGYWPLLVMGLLNLLLLVLYARRWEREWLYFQAWVRVVLSLSEWFVVPQRTVEWLWRWHARLRGDAELANALEEL